MSAYNERKRPVSDGQRATNSVKLGIHAVLAGLRRAVQRNCIVMSFDATDPAALFPLAEWLSGADAICTGAGYNSFWEARWLGYYNRTRFTAFGRHIDDQEWRLTECADYTPKENGADQLARWMMEKDTA